MAVVETRDVVCVGVVYERRAVSGGVSVSTEHGGSSPHSQHPHPQIQPHERHKRAHAELDAGPAAEPDYPRA